VDTADVNLDSDIEIKSARRADAPAPGDPALEPCSPPARSRPGRTARAGTEPTPPRRSSRRPRPSRRAHPKAREALRLFNEGEVEASIEAARASGSSALALRLASFRKEAALGESARSSGDSLGAVCGTCPRRRPSTRRSPEAGPSPAPRCAPS
jgi:hypothetical protein